MTLTADPRSNILSVSLVDDHDEAYHLWKARGLKQQVLLHFDAHIDFEWIAEKTPLSVLQRGNFDKALRQFRASYGWHAGNPVNNFLHLGNYLCRALQEGMVKAWYWVVPTPLWQDAKTRDLIWQDLLDYYRFRMGPMTFPVKDKNSFRVSIYGVPLTVTSLDELPEFQEPVLLNLDVDYLTTDAVDLIPPAAEFRRRLPWIWPDEFVSKVRALSINPEIVSIANSVRGGFTPIHFKFFGEVLVRLFQENHTGRDYEHLKAALIAGRAELSAERGLILDAVESEGVMQAAKWYLKAIDAYESGKLADAKLFFAAAAEQDPEFRSEYNSLARFYEVRGFPQEAFKEYAMIRALLPEHLEARLAETQEMSTQGKYEQAIQRCRALLNDNPHYHAAAEVLGQLYFKIKQWPEAEQFLKQSAAAQPLNFTAVFLLAKVFLKQKKYNDAKNSLREALGRGAHFPVCYRLLAQAYFHLGFLKKAAGFVLEALRLRMLTWYYKNRSSYV